MAVTSSKVFLMDKYFTEMEKVWHNRDGKGKWIVLDTKFG